MPQGIFAFTYFVEQNANYGKMCVLIIIIVQFTKVVFTIASLNDIICRIREDVMKDR